MKSFLRLLFVFSFLHCSTFVMAQSFEVDGLNYRVISGTNVSVSKGASCPVGAISIPAHVRQGNIEYTVTFIENSAFGSCRDLTSVTIPNSVTSIGYRAFSLCTSLMSVTISNSAKSIGHSAFANCSLTSVTIPNSVTSIGNFAFKKCKRLKSVTISNSVKSIGHSVFENCALTSVTIPNSVESIGKSAFADCSLTSVTIPNSVKSIGDYAFGLCRSLTSVTIPNSVTTIGGYAFTNCGLTSVIIPNSVTSIGYGTFQQCISLESILVEANNPNYASESGVLFSKDKSILIRYPAGRRGHYDIPNSVTSIGGIAFAYSLRLTSVTIPNSVESIGEFAFADCGLPSVAIPNSVKSIGDYAFSSCKSLKSVTIPNSVTSIRDGVFNFCRNLPSVTIPNSVKSIGRSAFSYCTSLTSVEIPNSVTTIGITAFYSCRSLLSVTIPNSVTTIGKSAFTYCGGLTRVTNLSFSPQNISGVFFDVDVSKVMLYAPNNTQAYADHSDWGKFKLSLSAKTIDDCYAGVSRTIDASNHSDDVYFQDSEGNTICMLNANGNNLGKVDVNVYKSSTPRQHKNTPYMDRNVTITPTVQPDPRKPVKVRIYYTKAEMDALKVADPSVTLGAIDFAKTSTACSSTFDDASAKKVNQTGSGTFSTTGSYIEGNVTEFSTFFANGRVSALPVEFVEFSATLRGAIVQLDWSTASEVNNDRFEVEHSTDGIQWTRLTAISGAGDSDETKAYDYRHDELASGYNYYRIKQVDYNGHYTYSDIRYVLYADADRVTFYPNPVASKLYFSKKVNYQIYDNLGVRIAKGKGLHVDVSYLPKGIYSVKFGKMFARRFSKL